VWVSGGVALHFLNSALVGGEWWASCPSCFNPWENITGTVMLWNRVKSLAPAANQTPAFLPITLHYNNWALMSPSSQLLHSWYKTVTSFSWTHSYDKWSCTGQEELNSSWVQKLTNYVNMPLSQVWLILSHFKCHPFCIWLNRIICWRKLKKLLLSVSIRMPCDCHLGLVYAVSSFVSYQANSVFTEFYLRNEPDNWGIPFIHIKRWRSPTDGHGYEWG
jgi:hypothetical protein